VAALYENKPEENLRAKALDLFHFGFIIICIHVF